MKRSRRSWCSKCTYCGGQTKFECGTPKYEKYEHTGLQTVENLSPSGLYLFMIEICATELKDDLTGSDSAIWVIVDLLVLVCLNCGSILDLAIASILAKWMIQSFCYSVVATSHHKRGILNAPKDIGCRIRR